MFSNRYIFTYASVMVIIVAAVLSTASQLLKPYQTNNIRNERFQAMLSAADIHVDRSRARETYEKYIVEELAVDADGNVVSRYVQGQLIEGEIRPFDIVLKEQLRIKQDLAAGKTTKKPLWPLFVLEKNGKKQYIIPLYGTGLWGPIWGNIALEDDFNTVAGTSFDHKSETPGLGAEIKTVEFQNQFKGKKIFDEQGEFTSIQVVKGGVANSNIPLIHGVDAISGGTITSNGVSAMLKNCLENYVAFFQKQKNQEEL